MTDRQQWLATSIAASPDASIISVVPVNHQDSLPELVGLGESGIGPGQAVGPLEFGTLLGRAVAQLHSLPVDRCPYQTSAHEALERVRKAQRQDGLGLPGSLDMDSAPELPEPYDRYSHVELADLVETQLGLVEPQAQDMVVIHGDLRPENLWTQPAGAGADAIVLFGGAGRLGVGDRHWDLAVVHRYLPAVVGAEALFAFYDAYGLRPNLVRLDAFILLSLLIEQVNSWPQSSVAGS